MAVAVAVVVVAGLVPGATLSYVKFGCAVFSGLLDPCRSPEGMEG